MDASKQLKKFKYVLLDVFTNQRFCGNQLAIFPDAQAIKEKTMQQLANELKLAETVFITDQTSKDEVQMRIFTPTTEMPTAGHPSIGTAFYLANKELLSTNEMLKKVVLKQKIGDIPVLIDWSSSTSIDKLTMYQPLPTFQQIPENRATMAEMISLSEDDLMLDYPIEVVSCGNATIIIPVNSIHAVKTAVIRSEQYQKLMLSLKAMVYVFTVGGEDGGDLHGRMFAEEFGVVEDAATGSANGPLACYVSKHSILPRNSYLSEQGFEMERPSFLHLAVEKDSNGQFTAVKIGGQCVYVGHGEIAVDS